MAWTLTKRGGATCTLLHVTVTDCVAAPASTWIAALSTDGGGNSGINFGPTQWRIAKRGGGIVVVQRVTVTASAATPDETFFAGASTDGGYNTGWSFAYPAITAAPRLTWNGQYIALPTPSNGGIQVTSGPPGTRSTSQTGKTERLSAPRVDTVVTYRARLGGLNESAILRARLENFVQWACQGGAFSFAADDTKTVATTLSAPVSAGATTVSVTSATGLEAGREYVMIDGPYLSTVRCESIAGTTVTLDGDTLPDRAFSSGAKFRDRLFWWGELRGDDMPQIGDDVMKKSIYEADLVRDEAIFTFSLRFFEAKEYGA